MGDIIDFNEYKRNKFSDSKIEGIIKKLETLGFKREDAERIVNKVLHRSDK